MGILVAGIYGGVIGLIVAGIRYTIWGKKEIPSIISKLRWFIAITIAVITIIVEAASGIRYEHSGFIGAGLVWAIAEILKKEDKIQNENKK
jgi:hypothetical protein